MWLASLQDHDAYLDWLHVTRPSHAVLALPAQTRYIQRG